MRTSFPPILLAALLSVLLSACSNGAGESLSRGPAPDDASAPTLVEAQPATGGSGMLRALPPLPDGHRPSGLLETSRDGVETFARSASAVDVDPVLQLSSQPGGLSWAVWELPAVDELRYLDVQLSLVGSPSAGTVYLALADFSSGRWELQGPAFGDRVLILDPQKQASAGQAMYAAVLAHDGADVLVQKLSLLAFHSNAAPTAALQADVSAGEAPLSVSFDAAASTDPEGGALRYHWDFDGDGGYERLTFTPATSFTYESPGAFNASVAVEDAEGEIDSASVEINVNVAGNEQPVAQFSADNSAGDAPLLVSFDAALSSDADGSIARFDWDLDGDGLFELYDAGAQVQQSYTAGGDVTAGLRVTDNKGAQDLASQAIEVNAPPLAVLALLPAVVGPDDEFFLDASQSSDPDGSIVLYEWDTDGDGSFERSGSIDNQGGSLSTVGPYTLSLRLTDNDGATSVASAMLHVRGFNNTIAAEPGDAGLMPSLAVVDGNPAAAYREGNSGTLWFVRANDAAGSSWGTPVLLDAVGSTGFDSSLLVVHGRPAVAYLQVNPGFDLKYVRALDQSGSSWGSPQTVDATGDTGQNPSLAIVGGLPAIAYRNSTDQELLFTRALDLDGSAWGSPVTVDSAGNTGTEANLLVVNGKPAIAYQTQSGFDLQYVQALDALGDSWGTPATVDAADSTGFHVTFAVVNGLPAIAYQNNTTNDLLYVQAVDSDGAAWPSPQTVDSAGLTGFFNSLAVIGGIPALAYIEYNTPHVMCRRALDIDGSAWGPPMIIDPAGGFAAYTSMVDLGGTAGVVYQEPGGDNLNFSRVF